MDVDLLVAKTEMLKLKQKMREIFCTSGNICDERVSISGHRPKYPGTKYILWMKTFDYFCCCPFSLKFHQLLKTR